MFDIGYAKGPQKSQVSNGGLEMQQAYSMVPEKDTK